MDAPSEKEALEIVANVLAKLLGVSNSDERVYRDSQSKGDNQYRPDMLLEVRGFRFVVEYKSSALLGPVTKAIELLSQYRKQQNDGIPLLVVPYMDKSGMRKCSDAEICWMDLSGNMDIRTTDLIFHIKGESNKFKRPGRRENPFAPKSSRIARRLLYHPHTAYFQRELSESTGLGEGYVSRIANTLEEQNLIKRDEENRLMARDSKLLLEAWVQGYDFKKHDIIRGHVAGRSGPEVQAKLSNKFISAQQEFAATGLGAAWAYSPFSSFRLVSFYIKERPSANFLESSGFREGSSGANVWLIVPKDDDVFYEVDRVDNVPTVHPVQVYLDLKYHPERSGEAAEELLNNLEL